MKKKLIFILLLLIVVNQFLFSQEVLCQVLKISPYYTWEGTHRYIGDLQLSDTIYVKNICGYGRLASGAPYALNIWFTLNNEEYGMYVKNVVPVGSSSLFMNDIFIDYDIHPDSYYANEMWVPAYYCAVLESNDRNTLLEYEPHLLKYNTGDAFEYGIPMQWYLHQFTHIRSGMYMFYNSIIYAGYGGNSFLIKNIEKTEYGYTVTCFGPKEVQVNAGPNFDWSAYPGGEVNLLLYVDDEYIDMYFNDTEHKFGTLVRVKEEFIRQYESLIETNTCDLTNVVWPRRADGSMDYQPPKPTQTAATEQPEVVDIADYGEAAGPGPVEETVGRQQATTGFPWVIIVVIAGIALVGVTAFVVILRKKR
jgi:hypothetical protein